MASPLEGFGYGLAGGAASTALGYLAQTQLASQQQKYYRENMAKSFGYSQLAQKLAPTNVKQGLVMAGMSPALAVEGKFSPAQSPSAPLGSNSMGLPNVNVAESMLAVAEARKADAEAEKTNIEVGNMNDENLTAQLNLKRMYEQLESDARKRGNTADADFFAECSKNVGSIGAQRSLLHFFETMDKGEELSMHKLTYRVDKAIAEVRMNTYNKGPGTDIIWDMAKMPSTERSKVIDTCNLLREQLLNAQKQGKILDFELELNKQQLENMKVVANSIENRDLKQLWDKGDYTGFAIGLFCLVIEALAGQSGRVIPNISRSSSHSSSENVNLNL